MKKFLLLIICVFISACITYSPEKVLDVPPEIPPAQVEVNPNAQPPEAPPNSNEDSCTKYPRVMKSLINKEIIAPLPESPTGVWCDLTYSGTVWAPRTVYELDEVYECKALPQEGSIFPVVCEKKFTAEQIKDGWEWIEACASQAGCTYSACSLRDTSLCYTCDRTYKGKDPRTTPGCTLTAPVYMGN